MTIPTYTQIPRSGLDNASIRAKFMSTSLAGLGADSFEESTGAIDPTTGGLYPFDPNYVDPNQTTLSDPFGLFAANPGAVGATQPYVDATGNMVIPSSSPGGGYVSITPSGTAQTVAGSSLPPRGSAVTTASQQAAQYALYGQLVKGSLDIAKLVSVQPGTTLSANGSLVRQNPGYSAIPPGTSGLNFGASLGGANSSTFLLLGLGLLALVMVSQRR